MNAKFVKTRKFVNENRTFLAFCAGSLLTSATFYAMTGGNTNLLKLSNENAQLLKEGGAVMYELKGQTLHLVNIPAAEAAIALAK